jgi:hypothetical protein
MRIAYAEDRGLDRESRRDPYLPLPTGGFRAASLRASLPKSSLVIWRVNTTIMPIRNHSVCCVSNSCRWG